MHTSARTSGDIKNRLKFLCKKQSCKNELVNKEIDFLIFADMFLAYLTYGK